MSTANQGHEKRLDNNAPNKRRENPETDKRHKCMNSEEPVNRAELTGKEIWDYFIHKTKKVSEKIEICGYNKWLFRRPKSLRGQLVVSVWIGLAAVFIPINIVNGIRDAETQTRAIQTVLIQQNTLAYNGISNWRRSTRNLLQLLAFVPQIRRLEQEETEEIFDRLSLLYPYRSWRLWTRDGDLLVGTNVFEPAHRSRILSRPYFQKSRDGIPSNGIYANCLIGRPCFVESVPVYGPGISSVSTSSSKPVGVLTIAIGLDDLPKDSNLTIIEKQIGTMMYNKKKSIMNSSPWKTTLSLQNKDFTGMEVLMVSKDGDVIFPMTTINDAISLQKPEEIMAGPWGPMVKIAMKANSNGKFEEITTGGRGYHSFSRKIDNEWSIVAVSDNESSYASVRSKFEEALIIQLVTLLSATIVVALVCRKSAEPIRLAATTIKAISLGDFEAKIQTNRKDEIGELFNDINQTGVNLRKLLTSQLEHAATDQQINTATKIQQSFVIQELPKNEYVDLAADFDPAYEIGADWYDAISTDAITYVVIADVCDKGIASALFMSVFRSLIRYSLLDEDNELEVQGLETSLEDSVTQVNDYMASNHGESSMFATLFLGAYVKEENKLSYICAGHETPIIIRKKGMLESLETTGPAIGIFAEAKYSVKTVKLEPGQILFTYTDGLVDSRSPSNISWGLEGVKGVLSNTDPTENSAKSLLDEMSLKVNQHRGDAEQFDDLTMLVMKVK